MTTFFYWLFFVIVDSTKSCFKKLLEHPSTRHVGLLMMFTTFNVILPSSDFITDILTTQSYFQRGHFYWGFCTMFFVFLPFLGRLSAFVLSLLMCLIKRIRISQNYPNKMTKAKVLCRRSSELIWHFPPLIIVRWDCKKIICFF